MYDVEFTFKQLEPLVITDIVSGNTPMLLGLPGIGKSSFIEDLARKLKTKVFTLPINQMADRADITGARIAEENGRYKQVFFPHSIIDAAAEYAENHPNETPILFLDEINRASSDITSTVLAFITTRMIGSMKFPDNLRFVTAGNDRGNVVTLDDASITRFVLYRVKPDIETFLSVQKLNPFIEQALRKNPEDLKGILPDPEKKDDENSNEEEMNSIDDFLDTETFIQYTNPRTITYLSKWLTNMKIDKTGSDEEKEVLKDMLDINIEDDIDILFASIVSHIGETTLAHNVYAEIKEYYLDKVLNSSSSSNIPIMTQYRPDQDIINIISRAKEKDEIDKMINDIDEVKRQDLFLWLLEKSSKIEINNNKAYMETVTTLTDTIKALDKDHNTAYMNLLSNIEKADKDALTTIVTKNSDLSQILGSITKVILEN